MFAPKTSVVARTAHVWSPRHAALTTALLAAESHDESTEKPPGQLPVGVPKLANVTAETTWFAGQASERTEPAAAEAHMEVGALAAAGGHQTFVSPRTDVPRLLQRARGEGRDGELRCARAHPLAPSPHFSPPYITKQPVPFEQLRR